METISKGLLYPKFHNEYLTFNKQEVEKSNCALTFFLGILGCLVFLTLLILSLFVNAYRPLCTFYASEFIFLCSFLIFFKPLARRFSSSILIYVVYGTLVAYATYISAFVTPDYTSVMILFLLFQIPIVALDKTWRINLVVVAYTLLYLLISVPKKSPHLVPDEIVNCVVFTIFGIGFGYLLRFFRLENFELKRQAVLRETTDYLTGLNNRRSLFERFSLLHQGEGVCESVGIIMLDIDYFKRYNDTYGHIAGDQCLRRLGAILRDFHARNPALSFFRYGGEEFLGFAQDYTVEQLTETCSDLNRQVRGLEIAHEGNPCGVVSVSIGFSAAIKPFPSNVCETLLHQADTALYEAKKRGRNQTQPYCEYGDDECIVNTGSL